MIKTIISDVEQLKMTIKTANFNPKYDRKLICTCNHKLCDKRSVRQTVLNMLQLTRIDYGLPMIITSGGRCQYHPSEVHRAKPADHQLRNGVDVKIDGLLTAMKLVAYGSKNGFNAFGINLKSGFIHMGCRLELKNRIAVWEY